LDIIGETYSIIREVGKELPADPFDYEQTADKAYELVGGGDTFGVFQLGGTAIHVCKKINPKKTV
jgi:DNA polymerase III alpha subunit